jgi:hypothetical protein
MRSQKRPFLDHDAPFTARARDASRISKPDLEKPLLVSYQPSRRLGSGKSVTHLLDLRSLLLER